MLELARSNAAQAGTRNVEFVKGYLEEPRLLDASVDVVISNCVINLSGSKPRVLAEAARVLRPGGGVRRLQDAEFSATHRVQVHAAAAIIRA